VEYEKAMSWLVNKSLSAPWHAIRLLLLAAWRRSVVAPAANVALLAALTIPLALSITVPTYADAAGLRILNDELARQTRQTQRPALALLFRHVRSSKAVPWRTIIAADNLMANSASTFLGLPLANQTRHIRTTQMRLLSVQGQGSGTILGNAAIGSLSGIDPLIQIIDGRMPQATATAVEIMVSRETANSIGLNIDDQLVITNTNGTASLRVMVVGIWQAYNEEDPAWLYDPTTLYELILVDHATMTDQIADTFVDSVAQAAWYLQPEITALGPGDIGNLEQRIRTLAQELEKVPAKLERSPLNSFAQARQTIDELTLRTGIIAAPIALLALFFVLQLATINYDRRRDELALLRSRGMSIMRILVIGAVEWLSYVLIACLPAVPLALLASTYMLRSESFLRLSATDIPIPGLPLNAIVGVTVIGVLIIMLGLRPLILASRRTLMDSGKSRRRDQLVGFLRILFEVLVLAAVGYGYYQLTQSNTTDSDVFATPLTLALPVLISLALALIANRILPLFFALAETLARRSDRIGLILALQTIARRPERLQTTVLLLTLTLGVGGYVASMAATVDAATTAGIAYRMGGDTHLIETAATQRPQDGQEIKGDKYLLTPIGVHRDLPGIKDYSAVGNYIAQIAVGTKPVESNLVAIDRTRFLSVVPYFRDEWLGNNQTMGALMNQLAQARDGAIISTNLAGSSAIGDRVAITINIDGVDVATRVRIVGIVNGWPGQIAIDKPFVVTNLGFIRDEIGFAPPTDVWITRDTSVPLDEVVTQARALAIPLLDIKDYADIELREFTRPERQGFFGMLSIGFIASTGLSVMAIFVSALAILRQRSIELGMLQALGMPSFVARRAIMIEQGLMSFLGIIIGLSAALIATQTMLPYLQAGVQPYPSVPPTQPITAWLTLIVMVLVYGAALGITAVLAFRSIQRLRVADAVKLGDEN
jgi:putative ABC transport system permease protein